MSVTLDDYKELVTEIEELEKNPAEHFFELGTAHAIRNQARAMLKANGKWPYDYENPWADDTR